MSPVYKSIFHNEKVVSKYNNCREIAEEVLISLSREILSLFLRGEKGININELKIADAGAGEGRFLIPLLNSLPECISDKVSFWAIDSSNLMLQKLTENIQDHKHKNRVSLVRHDIQQPMSKIGPFSFIFTAATFHILENWERAIRNLVNATFDNGILIFIKEINQFMHQTEGFDSDYELIDINSQLHEFMKQYHFLRVKDGVPYMKCGVLYSDYSMITEEMKKYGYRNLEIIRKNEFQWKKSHSFEDIIEALELKLITTWGSDIPDKERVNIANKLMQWLLANQIDINRTFYIHSRLEAYVYRK